VVKGHSNALSTMTSPGTGPVATVTRAGSRLVREPRRGVDIDPLVDGIESADVVPEVPVIHSGTGSVRARSSARSTRASAGS